MIHTDENGHSYYSTLEEPKEDGLSPVKVWSVLQFFTFRNKTSPDILAKVKAEAKELFNKHEVDKLSKAGAESIIRKKNGLPIDENIDIFRRDNLVPLPNLQYCVLAKYPGGDRYFTREFKGYNINQLYFYRRDLDFSGDDTAIENLRRYVDDSRVTLLLTESQIEATQELLKKLYKSQFKTEGKLDYRLYIKILEESLKLEDYLDYGKSLVGHKTVENEIEKRIAELWKQAKK